jgi:hypothetical protein
MERCITEWKQAWEEDRYYRWMVETKDENRVIGTIEIASIPDTTDYIQKVLHKKPGTFVQNPTHLSENGFHDGVLRIDLVSDYAKELIFDDILNVAYKFFSDYHLKNIIVQCLDHDVERFEAMNKHEFHSLRDQEGTLYPYLIKSIE